MEDKSNRVDKDKMVTDFRHKFEEMNQKYFDSYKNLMSSE